MMSGLLSAASAKWIVHSPSTHAVAAGMAPLVHLLNEGRYSVSSNAPQTDLAVCASDDVETNYALLRY